MCATDLQVHKQEWVLCSDIVHLHHLGLLHALLEVGHRHSVQLTELPLGQLHLFGLLRLGEGEGRWGEEGVRGGGVRRVRDEVG